MIPCRSCALYHRFVPHPVPSPPPNAWTQRTHRCLLVCPLPSRNLHRLQSHKRKKKPQLPTINLYGMTLREARISCESIMYKRRYKKKSAIQPKNPHRLEEACSPLYKHVDNIINKRQKMKEHLYPRYQLTNRRENLPVISYGLWD